MTWPGGPTKHQRPSRATRMASALKGTGEHRYTEGAFAMLGLVLLAWDLYAMLKHPPAGIGDQIWHGAWALVAIGFIPGAATRSASGIRELASAFGAVWKAKDKGAAP